MRTFRLALILFLLAALILITGCTMKPDAKVIECSNIFFKCDSGNCQDQCGKIATSKGKVLTKSEAVNDGSGCWCEYEDPERKIEQENNSFFDFVR